MAGGAGAGRGGGADARRFDRALAWRSGIRLAGFVYRPLRPCRAALGIGLSGSRKRGLRGIHRGATPLAAPGGDRHRPAKRRAGRSYRAAAAAGRLAGGKQPAAAGRPAGTASVALVRTLSDVTGAGYRSPLLSRRRAAGSNYLGILAARTPVTADRQGTLPLRHPRRGRRR